MTQSTVAPLSRAHLADHLIEVKGGAFLMGYWDTGSNGNKPVHTVQLDAFQLLRYPVTQSLWEEVMGDNPSYFEGSRLPVEEVSWYDAVAFCNRLSELEGLPPAYGKPLEDWILLDENGEQTEDIRAVRGYRLPTEAEWEYAAMDGHLAPRDEQGRHYPLCEYAGSNFLEEVGWYRKNSYGGTKEVGLKAPNALGLHDMSGNVLEWCWDWLDGKYYGKCKKEGLVRNPLGPLERLGRVVRGGGYIYWAGSCCLSGRYYWYEPEDRLNSLGFRLARSS